MKNFFLRALVFTACFCVEITVKANSSDLIMEPKNCWEKMITCSVSAYVQQHNEVELESGKVSFPRRTVFTRLSESLIRLIKGYVVVESQKPMVVQTLFGEIHLKSGGLTLIELGRHQVQVTALQHVAELQLLNKELFVLPAGYTNWMGGIHQVGKADVGQPRPASMRPVIEKWGQVYVGSATELREKLEKLRAAWSEAIEDTSRRDLASIYEQRKQLADWRSLQLQRERQRQKERQKLRELFYRKTFLE